MSLALPVDGTLLLAGGLLLVAVLVASARERLKVPGALLLLGLGMLVADDGLALVRFDETALARDVGIAALVVILFEGGLTTTAGNLRRGALPGFVLANVGVVVTTAVIGSSLVLLLDLSWQVALLLGAIVSSTDAAAVFDLLRRAPLPRRVAAVLEVESGTNDPFAVILTVGLLATIDGAPTWIDWLLYGGRQLVGGIVVGVVVGAAGAWLLRTVRLPAQGLYPVAALAVALLAYGVGAGLGASGLFATYLAGILVGRGAPRHRSVIRNFSTSLASAAEIGLFLLLGLLVFPSELPSVALPALAVTGVLLLLARPLAVAVSLAPFGFSWREHLVVSWAGLRGAVPIVLATFPFTAGLPSASTIFDVVFFVVLVSVTLQGLTVVPLVRRLGLATGRPAWETVAEAAPIDLAGPTMVELTVTPTMAVTDRPLAELPRVPGLLVTTVVRDGRALVPTGETALRAGDLALVAVAEADDAGAVVRAWARGEEAPPGDGDPA
jgi:cell volume regulation protein A